MCCLLLYLQCSQRSNHSGISQMVSRICSGMDRCSHWEMWSSHQTSNWAGWDCQDNRRAKTFIICCRHQWIHPSNGNLLEAPELAYSFRSLWVCCVVGWKHVQLCQPIHWRGVCWSSIKGFSGWQGEIQSIWKSKHQFGLLIITDCQIKKSLVTCPFLCNNGNCAYY